MPDPISALAAGPSPAPQTSASDGVSSPANASKSGQEGNGEASFAATLKSRLEQKSPQGRSAEKAAAESAAAKGGPATPQESAPAPVAQAVDQSAVIAPTDLAALIPMLEAALAGKRPAGPGTAANTQSADTQSAEDIPADPAAIAEAAAAAMLQPMTLATNRPTGEGAGTMETDTLAAGNPGAHQRNTGQGFPLVADKLAADAAITADTHLAGAQEGAAREPSATAIQPRDFQGLMDKALSAGAGNSPSSPSGPTPSVPMNTPFGQNGWSEEIGQKMTWMISGQRQQAELVLTPPQLGRIEVSLSLNGDQATASFTSANPAVREALENSMQRLRDVLADAGVTLGQTQVGAETFRQPGDPDNQGRHAGSGTREPETIGGSLPPPDLAGRRSVGQGMVDVFA